MNKKLKSFFRKQGIGCDDIHLSLEIVKFRNAMKAGLHQASSLKMIPTHIHFKGNEIRNEKAIVIDAGGTNLRVALVELKETNFAEIVYVKKYPMVGLEKEVSANEFFQELVTYLEPILPQADKIGFCFSFPTEITAEGDGIVIEMNKGVRITGIEGQKLGYALKETLKTRGFDGNYDITVINDTVACLLGGMIVDPLKQYDSFVGFILGTGTNTAFVEPGMENMIVNIESGGYADIRQTPIDVELNKLTENNGQQLFEKMISGAYLGDLAGILIQKANKEQFFTTKFRAAITTLEKLTTEDISLFMDYPYSNYNKLGKLINSEGTDDDRTIIFELIDQLLLRSAKLVAVNIIGIMDYLNLGTKPNLPLCISSEGSTFFKFNRLHEKILHQVTAYSTACEKYYCEFIEAKDSTLYGTAIAALLE